MRKAPSFVLIIAVLAFITAGYAQQTPPANKASGSGAQAAPATKSSKPAAPAASAKPTGPVPTTDKEKASYAIGLNIGTGLHRDGVDIDPAMFLQGLKDALAQAKPALTDEEMKSVLSALETQVTNRQQEALAKEAADNKAAGEAFLAQNKSKEGVVTLPSGLQYKILQQGNGPKPSSTDTVVCNYRGTLIDGTEFDSSYKRGEPVTFGVNQVIKAWSEALPLMTVGSKWQLFVPAELAYGERSPGPAIGPNSTLIFEVELLSIQEKTPGAAEPGSQTPSQPQKPAPGAQQP